ncbi:transcription factor TGA1-like isoform X1 [Vicia villosa]|uniref:transcription factor TGA1-like isoform X1 n=1 Tax=Vicia villosa TaxID=3911 RepID=UPI00273B9F68|nr:transcription factor TGA1-like isoform X1 [Vicia villosa]
MKETNALGDFFKGNRNTISVKKYALSSEEQNKLISAIHKTLNDHNHVIEDDKLQLVINTIMKHVLTVGSAITCESNQWWIGGFRPSQILQVILPQLQHMYTQQQLSDIYNLGQSCQQAEYALAQGMVKLKQNLDETTTADGKGFQLMYVPQQLSFFKQADNLRQEFLHQFCRLVTISQQAEFVVALKEHLHNPQPRSSL